MVIYLFCDGYVLCQLSFILRYVSENGKPVERFLCFIENSGHKAKELTDAVLTVINSYNIDISYLRGESMITQ